VYLETLQRCAASQRGSGDRSQGREELEQSSLHFSIRPLLAIPYQGFVVRTYQGFVV